MNKKHGYNTAIHKICAICERKPCKQSEEICGKCIDELVAKGKPIPDLPDRGRNVDYDTADRLHMKGNATYHHNLSKRWPYN